MRASSLRLFLSSLCLCLLAGRASATWSIVFVNHATGEVCVATATCIPDEELRKYVPVVVVGKGAGAAQYIVDPPARNRKIMFNGLMADLTPEEIMDDLLFGNGITPGRRQYGIAGFAGPAATWTGGQVDPGKNQTAGEVGELSFAIQGNSLTGPEVIAAAREALIHTSGDSGQRLLAAMTAAARLGGDGRCSCSFSMPTSCGVPPDGFRKSAHTLVMIVARPGDTDGVCNGTLGCANGEYYMDLEVIGNGSDPDPVIELGGYYERWRAGMVGRPDHVASHVAASADRLPADGHSLLELEVRLADLNGTPLEVGGASITVAPTDPAATPLYAVGPVLDRGDGTYLVRLRAGTQPGSQQIAVTASDGVVEARLWPPLELQLVPPPQGAQQAPRPARAR